MKITKVFLMNLFNHDYGNSWFLTPPKSATGRSPRTRYSAPVSSTPLLALPEPDNECKYKVDH